MEIMPSYALLSILSTHTLSQPNVGQQQAHWACLLKELMASKGSTRPCVGVRVCLGGTAGKDTLRQQQSK